jgi:hypothetical protein
MSPATQKTLMSVAAAVLMALAFVPQLAPYAVALTTLAGALGGGALIKRPGDAKAGE